MIAHLVTSSAVIAVAMVMGHASIAGQQTFRTDVRTVRVSATVVDRVGHLVTNLVRDDFEVLDNGRRVEITLFDNRPTPITAVALVKTDFFASEQFQQSRTGVRALVEALQAGDRLAIGSFGREVAISPLLTGDKAVLSQVVDEELWPTGGLAFPWRACALAIRMLEKENGRRALVLVTDGLTVLPSPGSSNDVAVRQDQYKRVEDALRRDGFVLYAVVLPGVLGTGSLLRDLTEETGGGHVELRQKDDAAETFGRVVDELRHQYTIGFVPATVDGALHRLETRVTRSGLKVRARRSYIAAP